MIDTTRTSEFAHIGKSVVIKGELSGSEDLYVDGVVEGAIELRSNNLVVGPNGQVRANISAKGVAIQGKVDGNIRASERVELHKTAVVAGDIATQRISIEEGAYLKGKVDVQKDGQKEAASTPISTGAKSTARTETAASTGNNAQGSSAAAAAGAGTAKNSGN
jgi:cytoskeletal protein CcmA (bactofilin family)